MSIDANDLGGWLGPLSFLIFFLMITFSFLTKKKSRISSVSLRSAGYKGGAADDTVGNHV